MSVLVAAQRLDSQRRRVLESFVAVDDARALAWYRRGDAKYGEPFWLAERLKLDLRRRNRASRPVLDRGFWEEYEEINRVLLPDDPVYSIVNAGATLSTTGDLLTHEAASAGQGRILEIIIGGEATASGVNRISVQRAGTAITANTAVTPEKFNTRSPAAAGTYGKAGTQALVGNPMFSLALNAFGGFIDWKAAPGEEVYYLNSEVVSMRSASGTSIVSATGVFEEL